MVPVKQMAAAALPQEFCTRAGHRWRVELSLPFTEIGEARFVYRRGTQRPGVRNVDLLRASGKISRKIAEVAARRLKFRKGIESVVVVKVVVAGQFLILAQIVIDLNGELVATISVSSGAV